MLGSGLRLGSGSGLGLGLRLGSGLGSGLGLGLGLYPNPNPNLVAQEEELLGAEEAEGMLDTHRIERGGEVPAQG